MVAHYRTKSRITKECMPKPERTLPLCTSAHRRWEGGSMLEQAESRARFLSAGSLRNAQRTLPILEPLSAVSRMVAFISHDLRQPLTAILANAEFLTRSEMSEMQKN